MFLFFQCTNLPPSFRRYTCTSRARCTHGETMIYTLPRCRVTGRKPPADNAVDSARRVLSYLLLSSSSSSLTWYYRRIALSSVKCFYVPFTPRHRYSCTCGMNRVRHTRTRRVVRAKTVLRIRRRKTANRLMTKTIIVVPDSRITGLKGPPPPPLTGGPHDFRRNVNVTNLTYSVMAMVKMWVLI